MDNQDFYLQQLQEARAMAQEAIRERDAAYAKLKEHEEAIKKAEKSSRMKSLFLANMSHEIRTPLNAIEGFSRVLAETDSEEERMKYLEIIESNNKRLQSLINEILDLSRVESGEITFKKTDTSLRTLCNSIKQSFKFRLHDNIGLKNIEPEDYIIMKTDPNRLSQVLSNLIGNALKHTTEGMICFGYSLFAENSKIKFFVSDTGTGIAPEDKENIFLTYVSKDAETSNNGHGLGLALCKIIVEKMGGHIGVDSELGKGSTFYFELPFEGTVSDKMDTHDSQTNNRTLRVNLKPVGQVNKKKVLVAEDEESNYQLLRSVLGHRYILLRALNGIDAVTQQEEENPDLILMDIRMPEMNGLDATRIIKEVASDVPIIALSAYAFEEDISAGKAAGCDDFLAKPFQIEELIDTIERHLK